MTEPGQTANANILDTDALVLYFPAPKTVTGEDVLELHVHGGSATVKAVLASIPKCSSHGTIRYAEQGEFTRRAFINDRLDLAQVESLGDTLAAETEQQRRAAVRGNSGVLGRTYESWREQLLLARGEIEALIDFSEDQHFDESPAELLGNVTELVDGILVSIQQHQLGSQRSELLRNGIRIALLGPPNVGKSSLMNLIVGREASIVSSEAGTTRDIVEASLDIRGYLCSFADTAGIRTEQQYDAADQSSSSPSNGSLGSRGSENTDASAPAAAGDAGAATAPSAAVASAASVIGAIEQEGIRRARKKALDSDVIIVLASVEPVVGTAEEEEGQQQQLQQQGCGGRSSTGAKPSHRICYDPETLQLGAGAQQCLVVINKTDNATASQDEVSELVQHFKTRVLDQIPKLRGTEPLLISCKTAEEQATGGGASASASSRGSKTSPQQQQLASPQSSAATTRLSNSNRKTADDPGAIHHLIEKLAGSFAELTSLPGDMQHLLGVTERQNQLLAECRRHLEDFMEEAQAYSYAGGDEVGGVEPDIVLAAEHLRLAAGRLAAITGRGEASDIEEVLGVIFEKFCVGK